MCKDHAVDVLRKKCDDVGDRLFKIGLPKLMKQFEIKREYEAQIRKLVREVGGDNDVEFTSTIQLEPHTAIKLKVSLLDRATVYGIGFSTCLWKDEFDPREGYLIAYDKAVRDAARQLAGL